MEPPQFAFTVERRGKVYLFARIRATGRATLMAGRRRQQSAASARSVSAASSNRRPASRAVALETDGEMNGTLRQASDVAPLDQAQPSSVQSRGSLQRESGMRPSSRTVPGAQAWVVSTNE